jgi:hypothetical protein
VVEEGEATGLVGFPGYNDRGIAFTTLFNPSLRVGTPVHLTSTLTPASGTWIPFRIEHHLECEVANGRWNSHVEAERPAPAASVANKNTK